MNFISRLFAESSIQIREGTARCGKGKVMNRALRDISSLAERFEIEKGEILIGRSGKVSFSRSIPDAARQRIRNVISSH